MSGTNQPVDPTASNKKVAGSKLVRWILITLLFLFTEAFTGLVGPLFVFAGNMIFGWLAFLWRTLPQISINWTLMALLLAGTGMTLLGLHSFCRWFVRHQKVDEKKWPVPATGRLLGILLLSLVSVMALTGFTHQIAWLGSSDDKWLVSQSRRHYGVKFRTEHFIKTLRKEEKPLAVKKLQDGFRNTSFFTTDRLCWIADTAGHVKTIVCVPRDSKEKDFAYSHNFGPVELLPRENLQEFLLKCGVR